MNVLALPKLWIWKLPLDSNAPPSYYTLHIKSKFLILLAIGQVNLEIIDYFKKV